MNGTPDDVDLNKTIEGSFRAFNPAANYPFTETFTAATFPPTGWNVAQYNQTTK
ncbi:MAG: hypothetical protein IPI22_03705 [Bacteroidetes bacterium]|nr:hypothetical protein [Bacteroidota bacterium]